MTDTPLGRSVAPNTCLYCGGPDPDCGFCDMGEPLDTQADWDASWGRIFTQSRRDADQGKS